MTIGEWIVESAAAFLTLRNLYSARARMKGGIGVTWPSLTWLLLWVVALILVPSAGLSSYHLLWILPLCVVITMVLFPLSAMLGPLQFLLALPGTLFGYLCAVGLDPTEVARNQAKQAYLRELLLQGVPPDEARRRVEDVR